MQIIQGSFLVFSSSDPCSNSSESTDLNMDFCSFDNGCKQLYEQTSMQEFLFLTQINISCISKSCLKAVDPDQLASEKPVQFSITQVTFIYTWPVHEIWY